MDPVTRATFAALGVFWGVSALYFVQPVTSSFALVAAVAATCAIITFLVLRGPGPVGPLAPQGPRGRQPLGAALRGPAVLVPLVAIALAVAHALWMSLTAFGYCTASPGSGETCQSEPSPPALLITTFIAVAGAGILLDRPLLAWAAILPGVALALLFGLSAGGALLGHVAVTLVAVAAWHLLRPRIGQAPGGDA